MAVNVIYAYVYKLTSNRVIVYVCISSWVIIAGVSLFRSRGLDFGWTPQSLPLGLVRVAFSFYLGVGMSRYIDTRHPNSASIKSDFASLLIVAIVVVSLTIPGDAVPIGIYGLFAITVIFPAAVYAGAFISPSHRLLDTFRILGLTSYAIYVFHAPFGNAMLDLIDSTNVIDTSTRHTIFGIDFLIILIFISWMADRYYDFPVRRKIMARFSKRRAARVGI